MIWKETCPSNVGCPPVVNLFSYTSVCDSHGITLNWGLVTLSLYIIVQNLGLINLNRTFHCPVFIAYILYIYIHLDSQKKINQKRVEFYDTKQISHKALESSFICFHHHLAPATPGAIHFPTVSVSWKALELRAEQAKEAQEALQMTLQAEASPLGGWTGWEKRRKPGNRHVRPFLMDTKSVTTRFFSGGGGRKRTWMVMRGRVAAFVGFVGVVWMYTG